MGFLALGTAAAVTSPPSAPTSVVNTWTRQHASTFFSAQPPPPRMNRVRDTTRLGPGPYVCFFSLFSVALLNINL
jgi:hypothetical protein